MLVFAIFVDKITLVCILSPNAPLGGKFVGLPSLNEILWHQLALCKISCF